MNPNKTQVAISYFDWTLLYRPIFVHPEPNGDIQPIELAPYGGKMFLPEGDELEQVKKAYNQRNQLVWTLLDDDKQTLISGFHIEHRLGHFICEVPFNADEEIRVITDICFNEMEAISKDGQFKAVWEWIGEGNSGEYNPSDLNDVPLLRFSCYVKDTKADPNEEDSWTQIDDASYCTNMPVTTPRADLAVALDSILREIQDCYPSCKRTMEWMSWIGPKDLVHKKE